MGLTSLHGQLTASVLSDFGFGAAARTLAAEANEAVDAAENQGNNAELANLHAMRGFLSPGSDAPHTRGPRMQTEDEARQKVAELLDTAQDKEYHDFEPWPFRGIDDALLHGARGAAYGLAPDYMFCHAQRDIGYVNGLLSLSLTAFDYSSHYERGRGWSSTGRVEVTQVSQRSWLPHFSVGAAGRTNGPFGDEGVVYGTLTWGRIPSRPEAGSVPPNREQGPLTMQRGPALCTIASEGANSLVAARQATLDFVTGLSQLAQPNDWQQLKSFSR